MFSQVPSQERGGGECLWYQVPSGERYVWGYVKERGRGRYVQEGWNLTPSLDTWDLGYYGIRSISGRYASFWNAFFLLPPRKGYVSTGVCLSTRGVSVSVQGDLSGGGSVWGGPLSRGVCQGEPPGERLPLYGNERAVCILLECILVSCI